MAFIVMYGYHQRDDALVEQMSSLCKPERSLALTEVKRHKAISMKSGDFIMVAESQHKGKVSQLYTHLRVCT